MKNNGFTLAELLAAIVIMAIIITIAVPGVMTISSRIQSRLFCEKVSSIESAAKLYGQDFIDDVESGAKRRIKVKDLISYNLLKKDSDNCTLGTDCTKDPRDNSALDNEEIELTIANASATYKRVNAKYVGRDASVCQN